MFTADLAACKELVNAVGKSYQPPQILASKCTRRPDSAIKAVLLSPDPHKA
jgi:hypothetical protein